jgi:aspartyl-tRNA(Asn)/glutamyl-tRNA(Gln) amidotransferase subunit A
MNPEALSAVEAAAAIRSGALSPVSYVESLLARIDRLEPRIHAWVTIDRDSVMAQARGLEAEARARKFRGPLHGVPVGIKDIFFTKGLRTTMGASCFADFVPAYDAAVVRKLQQAGAIILGKCVTTVLVFLDPGPTGNPWNTAHTPGGSSSGSAAAVAAGMCPLSIGSQTVGSVGRPGAFNGVASLMATQARISIAGAFPLAWSLDHVGAFSRSAADLRLLTECLSEGPLRLHPARHNREFRVGVVREFFGEQADAESQRALSALEGTLAGSGFRLEEARLPAVFERMGAILRTLVRAESASVHESLIRMHPESYGPKLRELVQIGTVLDATSYMRAKRMRKIYQREMQKLFERFDVLMTPAARGTAPSGLEATGDPVMNGPWSLADFPTMTLPYALGANGLPLGIQISAPPLQEALLFEIGQAMEAAIGFQAKPSL